MRTMALLSLLAAEGDLGALRGFSPVGKSTGMVLQDVMKIIGAVLILTIFLVLVIYIARTTRKSNHRRHHRHKHHRNHQSKAEPEPPAPELPAAPGSSAPAVVSEPMDAEDDLGDDDKSKTRHRHRRHRRRRHEHHRRNPTLAETGGLPPLRDPNSPPPPLL
jgi:ABC-type nickel/cobalt efflux system permease component RcnA